MITLLHGDNIEASRIELNSLRDKLKKEKEIITFDGKSLDLTLLIQATESESLFGNQKCIIIERLFLGLNARSKQAVNVANLLVKTDADIIIWDEKLLTPAQIKLLGTNIQIREFSIPKTIFQFLDSIKPGNVKQMLFLFEQSQATNAIELLFFMIVKRVRYLIILKDNKIIPGLQSWQAARLTTQAKFFTMDKLLFMHKKLLEIDYSIKSGNSAYDYKDNLELFLVEI